MGLALVLVGLVHFFVNTRNANIWMPNAALLSVPLVISFFTLSGMRVVFGMPAELSANWVFQLTAAAHWSAILAGVRKAMLWLAIVPLLVLSVPVYALLWGWPVALVHMVVCLLLSLILVELLLARFPKIPFTCTYVPGGANLTYAWAFYWVAFSTYAYTMASIEWLCLRRPLSTAVFCAVLAGLWWLLAARRREALREEFRNSF